jgi:hypothetical protein
MMLNNEDTDATLIRGGPFGVQKKYNDQGLTPVAKAEKQKVLSGFVPISRLPYLSPFPPSSRYVRDWNQPCSLLRELQKWEPVKSRPR